MSASLVGSEMCIRDSHSTLKDQEAAGALAPPPMRSTSPFQAPTPAGGAGAVSYTHLTLPTICSV
eukprot:11501230-Alexandrium_andersonii.AAC.1